MNKELETFEKLNHTLCLNNNEGYLKFSISHLDCQSVEEMSECLDEVEQALLKAEENARSEEILQKYYQEGITLDSVRALKQERDNYKKVLEIIKEKAVDVYVLFDLGTLDDYNKWVLQRYGTYYQLTQEEFETLKGMLK